MFFLSFASTRFLTKSGSINVLLLLFMNCIEKLYAVIVVINLIILLIDDVYTSGATVNECARMLKKGGATEVDVLTLARTA